MNPLIQLKTSAVLLSTLALLYFAAFPTSPSRCLHRPPGAIPTSPLLREITRFRLSPWALGTQQLYVFVV